MAKTVLLLYVRHKLENEDTYDKINSNSGCDENTHCVPKDNGKVINSNEKKMRIVNASNYNNNNNDNDIDQHRGKNSHSKTIGELDREQQILLKDNKEAIIDFLLDNKESIRVEDLKIYEPIYKCYRKKGNCQICKRLSNIICKNCNHNYNNEEIWLCTNCWKQHKIDSHGQQWKR